MKNVYLIVALILLCATGNAQTTIIAQNSAWKYLDNGSNQGTAWRGNAFSDTSWASGNAELGYGDGGEATALNATVKPVTSYFRKTFSVANPSLYSNFTLSLLRDDGAIVYLNGVEVARSNMPTGTISNTTLASSEITGTNETAYTTYSINPSLFVVGSNVLAIELHQATTGNIDSSFNLKLTATTGSCGTPIALNATSITTTTATLNWSAIPSIFSYSVQYRPVGSTTWTTVSASSNSKALTGLNYGTAYEFQVKANCLFAGVYSAPATFTTVTPTCATPTALAATNITATTANISWSAVQGALSYNIQGRITGTTTWTTFTSTSNAMSVTGLTSGTNYQWQVQAVCLITSAYSAMSTFSTLSLSCGTPTTLTSSAIAYTTATLSWAAVSGATSYNIQYKKTGTTTWTTVNSTTASKAITGLTAGTAYDFQVQGVCAITSAYSAVANFTTLAYSCTTPTALTSSGINYTTATLSWATVSGATSYNIQYRKTGTATWTTVTSTTASKAISGLTAATAYDFQVQGVCVITSAYSIVATFTTLAYSCGTPSGLTATNITQTSATLSWTAVPGAVSYNIQGRITGTAAWTTFTSNTNSVAASSLPAATSYDFQVQAVCAITSAYSAIATFSTLAYSCGTPNALAATAITTSGATLSWTAVSGATSYNIQYRKTGVTNWTATTSTAANKTLTNLSAATAYEFQVQAVCVINSAYSVITAFTTTSSCGTPSALSANTITTSSATLTWTGVSGATSYNIQYRAAGTTTWTATTASATTKSLTGLIAGTAYEFQVQTICTFIIPSVYSAIATFTTLGACGIPGGLNVDSVTASSASLSWAVISGATNYNIQYRKIGTTVWLTATSATNSVAVSNLLAVTNYEFQIQAICTVASSFSNSGYFTTLAIPTCGIPTTLNADFITASSATLSWQAVSGATGYKIQYRKTGTVDWLTATLATNSTAVSGLLEATNYEFQVQAICSVTSAFSNTANFTTLATPTCGIPTTLNTDLVTDTSAALSWQAVSGAVGYNIRYRPTETANWLNATSATTTLAISNLWQATQYEFQVQAVCTVLSAFTESVNFTTLVTPTCDVPNGLWAENITLVTASLSWHQVVGATGYNVQYRAIGTSTWSTINTTMAAVDLSNLSYATNYEFQVQALCVITSAFSASSNFMTVTPTCDVPTKLSASNITATTVSLTWDVMPGATSYNIQYRAIGTATWTNTNVTTPLFELSGLTMGTAYEFQAQALCIVNSIYSGSKNFSTLGATCEVPTALSVTNITALAATLSWQEVIGATGYNIQYRMIGSSTWNTATAATNTLVLTGLSETSNYEFQVQAVCTISNVFSASVNFTTLTSGTTFIIPAGSSWKYLDNGTNQGTAWNATAFDDSSWATANAEFGYGDGGEATLVNYGPDPLNKYITTYFRKSFTMTNLSAYSSISFELIRDDGAVVYLNGVEIFRNNMPAGAIAYNSLATVAASGADELVWYPVAINPAQILSGTNVIAVEIHQNYFDSSDLSFNGRLSATIPGTCGTPASLTSTNVGSSTATLNWQAIGGANSYNIQYRIVGAETWLTTSATTNTKAMTGLTPASNYEFKVQAVCGFIGNYSTTTGYFTTAPLTCNAPASIVISSVTTTTATITWQAATDAISYNIQYRPSGTTTWLTATSNIATIQLTNLTLSTSYEFQIQTVCSFPSAFSPMTFFATPAFVCNAPTGLSIASIVSSSVTLSWQAAEGSTGYVVEYQLAGTNAWASSNTNQTSRTINGLIASTGYEFRVKSLCTATSGSYSAVLPFTTYAAGATYFAAPNSTWKYLDTGVNQNTAWRDVTFNDTSWKTGNAEFGYGDGDEVTVVSYGPDAANKYPTTYFRKTFTIDNPANYSALSLGIVRDDGAVVYLNGTEVFRSNMPTGTIAYNTFAVESLGGSDETNWFTTAVDAGLLVAGANVLAVEIHQNSLGSSDLTFNGRLTAASNIATPVVTRGAYLQKLSSNSITIRWRTDIPSNTAVQYGTTIAYGNTASDNTLVTEHIITVPNLTPNTKYFYSIGTTTLTLQGDLKNNFITAPIEGTATPVRIWGIGDFGNGTNRQLDVRNAYTTYTGTTPTNLWLWLGDNAYTAGTDAEFQDRVFNQYTDQLKNMAVFPTPGNHDYNESGYQQPTTLSTNYPYFSIFSMPENGECGGVPSGSPKYYSFNYANIHFISIDSYGTENAPGSPMYTWLNNDLTANTQRWTVVFMHYPPYTYGTHNSDTETTLIDMRKIIVPLLESYHVDLLLAGHSHVNERSYMIKGHYDVAPTFTEAMKMSTQTNNFVKSPPYNGTVYAVCGTSGQNPEVVNQPGFPMPAMYFNNNVNNCSLVIDVNGDFLSCKYLTSTGSIADEFSITKTNTSARDVLNVNDQGKDALTAVVNQNSITLDYTLTQDSDVTAELINILGERVMEIQIPASQSVGDYNYEVPTKGNLAKGLYFIRMTINRKAIVKKVYVMN